MAILSELRIGLRTLHRELELLKRCGVKVRQRSKLYFLLPTAEEAEERLPFPDPELSFAEIAELARCDCPAGRRLANLLGAVIDRPEPTGKRQTHPSKGPKAAPRGKQPEARPKD
jgi:hypothetical protein